MIVEKPIEKGEVKNPMQSNSASNFCEKTEKSNTLFLITAQLIKYKLIELTDILEHLSPTQEVCQEFYESKINQGKLLYIAYLQNKDKEKEKEVTDFSDLFKFHDSNQKIMLLEALIKVNAWIEAEIMFNLMSSYFDILSSKDLCKTLCDLISFLIEPIYNSISYASLFKTVNKDLKDVKYINPFSKFYTTEPKSNENFLSQITHVKDLLPTLAKVFNILTIGLHTDIILFTKILRLVKHNIKFIITCPESTNLLAEIIKKVFFPSISLFESNPNMINELWLIVSEFEYTKRYSFYNDWLNNSYYTNPYLYIQLGNVSKETNKLCKTLNLTKENIRSNGRKLGSLSNSNPAVVFDIMIRVLISYDNQIPSFISSLSYCSYLSYDVISFIILKILSDPNRENLNQSSGDISSWLMNLANLTGSFYKKFHWVELGGIMCYIVNKLKTGIYIIFVLT